MLISDLAVYACPVCRGPISLESFGVSDERVKEGLLHCEPCGLSYPIVRHVPRFVPRSIFNDPEFLRRHDVPEERLLHSFEGQPEDIEALQQHTDQNFGHQWEHYARFGWDDEEAGVEESRRWFLEKTLLELDEIDGRIVLDAGCGNGRYARVAAENGARVFAVDLGRNVEVAYANLRALGLELAAAQADIFHLPFASGTFDVMYTIGVVQHTGDAKQAVASLADTVRPDGLLSVRAYRRGNDRLEENDSAIRAVTTTWNLDDLHEFSALLHDLTIFLKRMDALDRVARHVNLFLDEHSIFDWYAAPVADKLTYRQCRQWFADLGIEILRDLDDGEPQQRRKFDALSILGRKE